MLSRFIKLLCYIKEIIPDYEYNKQQLERSMFCTPGIWKSKGSEKDIEENTPVPTREKVYILYFKFQLDVKMSDLTIYAPFYLYRESKD